METILTVIVNWKLKHETVRAVRSVARSSHPTDIIVVDNGSGDDSAEFIAQACPFITLLPLNENIGFGPACNHAIRHGLALRSYDYIFLFNNDAIIDTHALSELLTMANQHPGAGILGAKVYYRHAPTTIWYAGARRRQGVLAATDIGRGEVDTGQFDQRRHVDYIFGAAMFIRTSLIEAIGCFDERFFLYLEDLDLSLRAQEAGYDLLFVPKAHVWHDGSASTKDYVAFRRYQMARSTIHYLLKHTRLSRSLFVIAFWVLVYLRDIVGDIWRGNWAVLRSSWQGLWTGLREAQDAETDAAL